MKTKILFVLLVQAILSKPVILNSQTIIGYSDFFELGIQQNNMPAVIGYSDLFSVGKQHNENPNLIGYSSLFTLGRINSVTPNLIGYSGVFQMNTRTGLIITGYSNLFTLSTKTLFSAWPLVVGTQQTVKFNSSTEGILQPAQYVWNFGDMSTGNNRFQANPEHKYSRSGSYTVSLTITNSAGVTYHSQKTNYISVGGSGIKLDIIKTDSISGPEIAKVRYFYTTKTNNQKNEIPVTFDVINGKAMIDKFPGLETLPSGTTLTSAFNDKILLYDQNMVLRGHINYEYEPEKEKEHTRNAILILHNDSEICAGNAFPYSTISPEYDPLWKYYKIAEYPVSMLIPPKNTFQTNYSKTPLLLIHGWEGSYELKKNPNAIAENNETSYWFTTVKQLNENNMPFDAWQFYYPYNDAHKHLAICLKSALAKLKSYYPSKKVRLVTHSMGGLVTLRYLTQFPDDANNKVEKVLFSAPPAHGSLGANLYYKTKYSSDLEKAIEMDPNAPSVRDMKLGSDATWLIHQNKNLPDLNSSGGISDDYFVLLGTTYKWYKSDKRFQAYDKGLNNAFLVPHSSVHPEAANHHDGIVAVSSGSLLDHGIGFATFHGNHNDAVHMQSFRRDSKSFQNIGEASLLPNIIKSYFTENQSGFFTYLQGSNKITSVVKHDRTVLKPSGQNTIDNLNTGNGVDYQKGILNLSLSQNTGVDFYHVYYKKKNNVLVLSPDRDQYKQIFLGYIKLGVFNRVINKNQITNNYYFNDKVLIAKENQSNSKAITYNGCAMDIEQGNLSVIIENNKGTTIGSGNVNFRYCETVNSIINFSGNNLKNGENNFTDTKYREVLNTGKTIPDSLLTPFYIDDQATSVRFELSSFEASLNGLPVNLKLRLPDGLIADSTLPGSTFQYNQNLGVINIEIPNPMPGLWHIWLESDQLENDTIAYNALAHIQSNVYAWLLDTTEVIAAGTSRNIKAALEVNDLNLASQLKVMVTIFNLDDEEETYDITASGTAHDSSYVYSHDYVFNSPGQYFIKYNIDGVYNNFNFERCLHQYIEAVDTIPVFSLPDITLRQNENFRELDLLNYKYNISGYDTIYFSSEIVESTVYTTTFSTQLDSTATAAYFFSSLADTGMVRVRFVCHYDENSIADTMFVNILVPDLAITSAAVSDTVISNGGEIIVDYTIANTGSSPTGSYEVKYFILQDSALQVSDFALGSFQVLYHEPDSIINVSDTLTLPQMALAGNYFLMIQADATEVVSEIDETNNQALLAVAVNPPPDAPVVIAAVPGNEQVHLSYTAGGQDGITGFIIYYGLDSTHVLQQIYPYSTDTTYMVTGLINDSTYYFALSCYRTVNNESLLSGFVSAIPRFISDTLSLEDLTLGSDADTCFAATATIIASDLTVESDAAVVLVAGENIQLQPLVQIMSGAQFKAYIDTTGNYCQQSESIIAAIEAKEDQSAELKFYKEEKNQQFFSLFPNPTTGTFTLQLKEATETVIAVEIYSMLGERILQTQISGQQQYEFDLSSRPGGVYLVRVVRGDEVGVEKVVKQ